MILAIAFLLTAGGLVLAAITDLFRNDEQHQADNPEAQHPGDLTTGRSTHRSDTESQQPGWLPATLPAMPADSPPRSPRICAGRVAVLRNLVTVCDPAGWPVATYAAGQRWPAQEGMA